MPHHLAILTDFPEEGWRSMDLCGDMLFDHLPRDGPYALNERHPRHRLLGVLSWQSVENLWDGGLKVPVSRVATNA